jgi:hypothetical protein
MDIIGLLGGISAKLYDDVVDEKIEISDTVKECLKGVQWMMLALLSANDFNFILIFYTMNLLNYFGDPSAYSGSYEFSLLLMIPLLFLLNVGTIHSFDYINIITIISFLILFFVEPIVLSTNVSYAKLIHRSIGTTLLILLSFGSDYLQLSPSIIKITTYLIGYGIISILFQLYLLSHPRPEQQPVPESALQSDPNETILKTKE